MLQDAASPVFGSPTGEAPDFPADTQTIVISPADFAVGGVQVARFRLRNTGGDVLHVRLAPAADYLVVVPGEAALGPGETQAAVLRIDTGAARAAVHGGSAPGAAIALRYHHLAADGGPTRAATPHEAAIAVHLPIGICPACKRSLDAAIARGEIEPVPPVCPYCYERLRPCPVCGSPNSWRARRCALDTRHIVRDSADWGMTGGGPAHEGMAYKQQDDVLVAVGATNALSRRWSYPSVPARRENALTWSAPVAAYGMVAAAAATANGDAHIYAFDGISGAPLWDPYPLPDPIYPDRGGIAIENGRLYAATVNGVFICLDALRGTRLWETRLPGGVYGAVVALNAAQGDIAMVAVAAKDAGIFCILDGSTGGIAAQIVVNGVPDTAPAWAEGLAYVHDDGGTLTAIDTGTRTVAWAVTCPDSGGFDAAPVIAGKRVFSASAAGIVWAHDAADGALLWRAAVTDAALTGTPACDGTLLYLPAEDALHVVSVDNGRSVRRYPTRQPVRGAPVLTGGAIVFGATDGSIYGALPGRSLETLYETASAGSQIVAAPAFADDTLYIAATNGVLYALAAASLSPSAPEARVAD